MRFTASLLSFIAVTGIYASPIHAADQSPDALFKRLSALAATGNADVKYNLGMFLNSGFGTPRDNKAAFRFFSEAAEAGNDLASYKVGCYYAGQFPGVVPFDEESAIKFKLRAAEAGYDLAQYDVALNFARKGDLAKAVLWWERASHQANLPATAHLANYFTADLSPDKIKGFALLLVLKERMPNPPKELSDRIAALESQMSISDKTEANRIGASWVGEPTPLTAKARRGISAVPALLTALER